MAKIYKSFFALLLTLLCCLRAAAADDTRSRAMALYESGLYVQAMDCFQSLPSYGNDPMVDGYVAMCALKLHTKGYDAMLGDYLSKYSSCALCDDLYRERGYDHFDAREYEKALQCFDLIRQNRIPKKQRAAYHFKRGYSYFCLDNEALALYEFNLVTKMPSCDYTAPSHYITGYLDYRKGNFNDALLHFNEALKDERFVAISNYYIVNCKYGLKDYAYVLSEGVKLYRQERIPADRKAHLARIISESYLLMGDKSNARKFYDNADDGSPKTRADYFYAGSLMFTTGEYKKAISNYASMKDKSDSLGQIALYQTGLSYINLNNKVAALDAFKAASVLDFDPRMTEDASFNYAKLAFDLNGDTSVFAEYLKRYSDKVRGESIYSYMALTALADRDFQAAIDTYDKIDVLEGKEKDNYVHANYLRGAELLQAGSYRNSIQCFKAVCWYTQANDRLNQLARYALAEACYRDGQYSEAAKEFSTLYNSAALDGMSQNQILAYNVAYSYLKSEDYAQAARWFGYYAAQNNAEYATDARLRRADCLFVQKDYATAAQEYADMAAVKTDEGLYPRYKSALAYNLIKKPKLALEVLGDITTADPATPYYTESLFELGRTRHQLKNTEGAKKAFSTLVDKAPDGPYKARALLEIGTIRRNSSDKKGALECYRMVVEQMPLSGYEEDALLAIESIYQSMNMPQEYFAYLESIGKGSRKTEAEKRDMVFASAQQIFYDGKYQKALLAFDDYLKSYKDSVDVTEVEWFQAQCYDALSDKVQAADLYERVLASDREGYRLKSLRRIAALNYDLQNYSRAVEAYGAVLKQANSDELRIESKTGLMRSSWKLKDYQKSADAATALTGDSSAGAQLKREALYVKAGSLLALSRRSEAMSAYSVLAQDLKSAEGAEAEYILIQDAFDRADYKDVENKVFKFSSSGTSHNFWLAKAFIVLGDAYAAQGFKKKAEATYQSIEEGYPDKKDGVLDELHARVAKLNEAE